MMDDRALTDREESHAGAGSFELQNSARADFELAQDGEATSAAGKKLATRTGVRVGGVVRPGGYSPRFAEQ